MTAVDSNDDDEFNLIVQQGHLHLETAYEYAVAASNDYAIRCMTLHWKDLNLSRAVEVALDYGNDDAIDLLVQREDLDLDMAREAAVANGNDYAIRSILGARSRNAQGRGNRTAHQVKLSRGFLG